MVFAFLFYSAIIHETTHALIPLAFGYHFLGFYFGFPFSYVRLSGANQLVYLSGGLVDGFGLLAVWIWGRKYLWAREQVLVFSMMLIQFVYCLWEAFVYPNL
jgi:hypothetical protein